MSTLSIVIASWNTSDVLAGCLASIFANAPAQGLDVWVIDNASSDGSAAMVRERYPQVHLIENAANAGFARANNQGIEASRGEYVLLLNSDTLIQPHALAELVRFMDENPRVGLAGPNVRNVDGSPQWCFGGFPNLLSELALLCGLDRRWPLSSRLHPVLGQGEAARATDWVLGAAMMLRRSALQDSGLLDGNFFMYSEEVDLAQRLKAKGWSVYVLGSAVIVHLGQQSSRRAPAHMKAQLFVSKELYLRKHRGPFSAAALAALLAASIAAKYWGNRLLGKRDNSAFWLQTWRHYRRLKTALPRAAALSPTVSG